MAFERTASVYLQLLLGSLVGCGAPPATSTPVSVTPPEPVPACVTATFDADDADSLSLAARERTAEDIATETQLSGFGIHMRDARDILLERTFAELDATKVDLTISLDGREVRARSDSRAIAHDACEEAIRVADRMLREQGESLAWMTDQLTQAEARAAEAREALARFEAEHGSLEQRQARAAARTAELEGLAPGESGRRARLTRELLDDDLLETEADHLRRESETETAIAAGLRARRERIELESTRGLTPERGCRPVACGSESAPPQ